MNFPRKGTKVNTSGGSIIHQQHSIGSSSSTLNMHQHSELQHHYEEMKHELREMDESEYNGKFRVMHGPTMNMYLNEEYNSS